MAVVQQDAGSSTLSQQLLLQQHSNCFSPCQHHHQHVTSSHNLALRLWGFDVSSCQQKSKCAIGHYQGQTQLVLRQQLTYATISGELVSNGAILVQGPANLLGSATCSQHGKPSTRREFKHNTASSNIGSSNGAAAPAAAAACMHYTSYCALSQQSPRITFRPATCTNECHYMVAMH
jgi:hypothetical protein